VTRRRKKKRIAENPRRIPNGAVIADRSRQVPNNSYGLPPSFYINIEFTCSDCGSKQVWEAEQQKWFYEVAKGSLYETAKRCRACRDKIKAAKDHEKQFLKDRQK